MRSESGQAVVETAITLPLTVFLVLGTLQLFMMLQGRLMAEHAAFKAVRAGVVKHGDCDVMTHAAIAALLPSFTSYLGKATPGATAEEKLANAFRARTAGMPNQNQYDPALDNGHNRAIVWIYRERPTTGSVSQLSEHDFDDPNPRANGEVGYRLEVRLVYWFPLRIPFANWVMSTMFRAAFGLGDYVGVVDPTMPVTTAKWQAVPGLTLGPLAGEFNTRFGLKQWSFPITTSYAMRMMTPPRVKYFQTQNCPPAP